MFGADGKGRRSERKCDEEGCDEKHFGRGKCKTHHQALYRRENREREKKKQASWRVRAKEIKANELEKQRLVQRFVFGRVVR